MAHPVVHLAVTAEMAALYWIGSGREEKRRRKIFATMAIIFCGFLVDIDHLLVDGGISMAEYNFIFYPAFQVFWLHSWPAFAGAAILSMFLRSQVPFWAFSLHMFLDGINFDPVLIHKPLVADVRYYTGIIMNLLN